MSIALHDDRSAGGDVLARLLRLLGWRRDVTPPTTPAPRETPAVTVTPPIERQRIDARLDRLRANEARLAVLHAEAGLDELRTRPGLSNVQ